MSQRELQPCTVQEKLMASTSGRLCQYCEFDMNGYWQTNLTHDVLCFILLGFVFVFVFIDNRYYIDSNIPLLIPTSI